QERSDGVDRTPHIRRRRRFPRVRIAADQTGASFRFARLRQLHTADAARPPRDATSADSGVEKSKGARGHSAAILASVVAASISDLARYSAAKLSGAADAAGEFGDQFDSGVPRFRGSLLFLAESCLDRVHQRGPDNHAIRSRRDYRRLLGRAHTETDSHRQARVALDATDRG